VTGRWIFSRRLVQEWIESCSREGPLCTEIARLKVKRTPRGQVVALRAVAVASGAPRGGLPDEETPPKTTPKTRAISPGVSTRF
jgi:hypothetical protein